MRSLLLRRRTDVPRQPRQPRLHALACLGCGHAYRDHTVPGGCVGCRVDVVFDDQDSDRLVCPSFAVEGSAL